MRMTLHVYFGNFTLSRPDSRLSG